jgi:UPF0755 protein
VSAKRRLAGRLRLALLAGLTIAVLVAGIGLWSYAGPGPKAPSGEATTVVLARGSGVKQIADIPSGASMGRVLGDIQAGRVVRRLITIPEGWTSGMAVDALNAAEGLTGVVAEPPEGSLLPDTYEFQRGDTRESVVRRMQAAHDKLVAELWAGRQPGLPLATPKDAVNLASIVEKETGVPAERSRVAAIFINRLRAGMPLQTDPTIIYGVTRGRPLGRGIRASELAADSPYNSYRTVGLPPTPIANPGRESLAAVLNPPRTDELYFVADGSGGHAFARTYEEHERNVARWRAIERQRTEVGQ